MDFAFVPKELLNTEIYASIVVAIALVVQEQFRVHNATLHTRCLMDIVFAH